MEIQKAIKELRKQYNMYSAARKKNGLKPQFLNV